MAQTAWIGGVNLHVIPAGPIPTNAYLLTEPALGEAVLIDAPGDIWSALAPILKAENCRLKAIWITHGHWDHTQGGAEVVRATGAEVWGHANDRMLFENPKVMSQFMDDELVLEPIRIDHWLLSGQVLKALGTSAEVRHVPGHCPGNVLFYFSKPPFPAANGAGVAFVGDTLFKGGVGRTDFPGGNASQLERSIRTQIYTLPGATIVYPGHGANTTVAEEKVGNPFVRG